MKAINLRNYLTLGLTGIAGAGLSGCGWTNLNDIHGDCLPQKTDNFYYETQEECEANGGGWGRWGLLPDERCNMRTSDYGISCNAWGDCEGVCIADGDNGYCSEHVTEFGCYTEIVGCGEEREICRD